MTQFFCACLGYGFWFSFFPLLHGIAFYRGPKLGLCAYVIGSFLFP